MPARIHYIDNTRALASLLGIFYHASLVFSSNWHVNVDPQSYSTLMYNVFHVFTYFRMPLFLIVAGYFTAYALGKYSAGEFLKHRAFRIVLPFVFSLLSILPMQLFFAIRAEGGQYSMMQLLAQMNPLSPGFRMAHLWFLYYVIAFTAVCYLDWHLRRARRMKNSPPHYSMLKALWVLAVLFAGGLVAVAGIALLTEGWPFQRSWLPLASMARLFPIFYLGYLCFHRPELLRRIHQLGPACLLLGILLYLPLSHLRTVMDSWFVGMVSEAILSWLFTLGVFHLVKRFLDWNNPTLAYMSEASYGVYLLHQPVIVMLASVFLAPLGSLPVWPAYALLLGSSLLLTYLSYHLLIKRSATGALLLTGLVRRRA